MQVSAGEQRLAEKGERINLNDSKTFMRKNGNPTVTTIWIVSLDCKLGLYNLDCKLQSPTHSLTWTTASMVVAVGS